MAGRIDLPGPGAALQARTGLRGGLIGQFGPQLGFKRPKFGNAVGAPEHRQRVLYAQAADPLEDGELLERDVREAIDVGDGDGRDQFLREPRGG